MATELIKRTIGGDEYEFEQFGAKQSLRVLMRLSKLVGKPLMLSMGAIKKDGEKKFNEAALAEAAKALFDGMDENGTLELIEMLTAEKVLCNGKTIKFDTHYAPPNLNKLFEVLLTALDVQYGNFLEELIGSLDLPKKPETSTPEKAT